MNLSGEAWAQIAKEEQDTPTQQAGHLDTVGTSQGEAGVCIKHTLTQGRQEGAADAPVLNSINFSTA